MVTVFASLIVGTDIAFDITITSRLYAFHFEHHSGCKSFKLGRYLPFISAKNVKVAFNPNIGSLTTCFVGKDHIIYGKHLWISPNDGLHFSVRGNRLLGLHF